MVQVKLFGLFRLDTGLKDLTVEVGSVRELYPILLQEARKVKPETKVTAKDIDGCIVIINGKPIIAKGEFTGDRNGRVLRHLPKK